MVEKWNSIFDDNLVFCGVFSNEDAVHRSVRVLRSMKENFQVGLVRDYV